MKKTEQMQNLVSAYIEVCQEAHFNDSQIIDALLDIFEPTELIELGYGEFIKNYMETPDEEPKEVIWEKYLKYLHEWASSHFGSGFYGMTPACFDEWLGCEYRQEMADKE